MLEKVENYIRQWKMLAKGDKVVIGVSGGADSVCLYGDGNSGDTLHL